MKPTKNKIFCVSCKRPKMLFESQAKADNFILYNKEEKEEENGKAPVRSYYCRLCGGWHVTSNLSEVAKSRSERRDKHMAAEADRFAKIQEDVDSVIDELYCRWGEAKAAIQQGRLRAAELLMKKCLDILNSLRISTEYQQLNWDKWAIHISDLQKKIARYKEFIGQPKKEREALLEKEDKTKEEEEICLAYLSYQTLFKIETLLEEVEKDIQKGDKDVVKDKLIECRTLVNNNIQCPYKNSLKKDYKNRIKEKCNRAGVTLDEEAKPRYLIDDKYRKYKEAMRYLTKKFEALQSIYDSGDYYEGLWQLSKIGKSLKELPENPETKALRQQYEHWGELFAKQEDEELDFIINYDIKYRMGDELMEQGEQSRTCSIYADSRQKSKEIQLGEEGNSEPQPEKPQPAKQRQQPARQIAEPKDNTLTMIVGKDTIERIKSGEKTTFKRYLDDEEFAKEVLVTENGRIKLSNDHCPYTAKYITSVKLVCDGNSLVKPVTKITFRTGINQQGKTAWKIVFHF